MKLKNKLESLFGDNTIISIKNGQVASISRLSIKTPNEVTKDVVRKRIQKKQTRRQLKDGFYVLTVEVKGSKVYSSLQKVLVF